VEGGDKVWQDSALDAECGPSRIMACRPGWKGRHLRESAAGEIGNLAAARTEDGRRTTNGDGRCRAQEGAGEMQDGRWTTDDGWMRMIEGWFGSLRFVGVQQWNPARDAKGGATPPIRDHDLGLFTCGVPHQRSNNGERVTLFWCASIGHRQRGPGLLPHVQSTESRFRQPLIFPRPV